LLSLAASMAILSSCGSKSSSSSTSTPTITVSCLPSSVTLGGTSTCTATITNLSSTLANFSVNGGSSNGTIVIIGGGSGNTATYTAPATLPTNNVVTITAAAQAQTSLTATTTVTLIAPTAISAVTCLDSTGTQATTVSSGNTLACTATSSTGATVAVNWTLSGGVPGAKVGTISSQGVYIAPLVPPSGGTVTITATSQAVSTISKATTINVVFGNKVIQDSYVFSTSGRLINSNAFFARVGSFTAGNGSISGTEDTNQAGTSGGVRLQRSFSGSYSVGPDGRGTMQFCEDVSSSCPFGSQAATAFFSLVVVSPQRVELIEYSNSSPAATSAETTGAGEMIAQDGSVFRAGNGNLTGTYSFGLAGVSPSGAQEAVSGDFTADGFGTIGANSPTTPGEMDINAGGAQPLATKTVYSVSPTGRGTLALNNGSSTLNFSLYVISASRAKFLEVDAASSILVGDAYKQQAGFPCQWAANVLSGPTVFETTGVVTASGVYIADVGSFSATNGAVSAGSIDENNGGTYTPPTGTLTGNYTVDPCGRGALTLGTHSYVFYVISPSSAILQETTSGIVANGFLAQAPSGASFANSSLNGSYALQLSGTDAAGTSGKREDIGGQLTADGAGTVKSGSFDINDFGTTSTGVAINGTYLPTSGSLRATMPLSPTRNLVLYLVSPTLFYVLDADAAGAASGVLYNQF
jgi:hypothetical protein